MFFLFQRDTWVELYSSLRKNIFRTIVTMIGVWWGVMMFIVLLGITKGVDNWFSQKFGSFATNTIFVLAKNTSMPYKGFQSGRQVEFREEFGEIIKKRVQGIESIKFLARENAVVLKDLVAGSYQVSGNNRDDLILKKKELFEGRYIDNLDVQERSKVVMISENLVDQMFKKEDEVIGTYLNISESMFKIIGVYKKSRFDEDIYMPISTFLRHFNIKNTYSFILVTAKEDADIYKIELNIQNVLKELVGAHPDDTGCLNVFNLGNQFRKFVGMQKGLVFLTWVVGIATLIAGVLAIGNILLITVKERTQEIGIRRAIGAQPSQIKNQIVFESVFIASLAGIIGLISGGLILILIDNIVSQSPEPKIINPSVSLVVIFGAILFIIIIASLIGLMPAYRAISVKPIDALRDN